MVFMFSEFFDRSVQFSTGGAFVHFLFSIWDLQIWSKLQVDHPMGVFTYDLYAQYSADAPVVRRLLGSSSGTAALTLSSEGLIEANSVNPRRLSTSETRQMPSSDNNIDTEG